MGVYDIYFTLWETTEGNRSMRGAGIRGGYRGGHVTEQHDRTDIRK